MKMAIQYPVIGQWFTRPNGTLFEVVAIDEDDATVEIQQFDGTIDEVDIDRWPELLLTEASAPEDWSGSVDMDPEDYVGKKIPRCLAGTTIRSHSSTSSRNRVTDTSRLSLGVSVTLLITCWLGRSRRRHRL